MKLRSKILVIFVSQLCLGLTLAHAADPEISPTKTTAAGAVKTDDRYPIGATAKQKHVIDLRTEIRAKIAESARLRDEVGLNGNFSHNDKKKAENAERVEKNNRVISRLEKKLSRVESSLGTKLSAIDGYPKSTESSETKGLSATTTEPVSDLHVPVSPDGRDGKIDRVDLLAKSGCWKSIDPNITEVNLPIFGLGQSTLSGDERKAYDDRVEQAVQQMMSNAERSGTVGRIASVEVISSASHVGHGNFGDKQNKTLAQERGASALKYFMETTAKLKSDKTYGDKELYHESADRKFSTITAQVSGDAYTAADESLKGKTPSETDIAAAIDKAAKTESPVCTREDWNKCCKKDAFTTKFAPYQFVKLKIHHEVFDSKLPSCVAADGVTPPPQAADGKLVDKGTASPGAATPSRESTDQSSKNGN